VVPPLPTKPHGDPRRLERAYRATHRLLAGLDPLLRAIGYERLEPLARALEQKPKEALFGCQMCGQCVLHSTGMVCPMTCPKQLRNGPCGGVRPDGGCEVYPQMTCVWLKAVERSHDLDTGEEINALRPPVDNRLWGRSAWLTALSGRDQETPAGWLTSLPLAPESAQESSGPSTPPSGVSVK
jgi:hypothetical protein